VGKDLKRVDVPQTVACLQMLAPGSLNRTVVVVVKAGVKLPSTSAPINVPVTSSRPRLSLTPQVTLDTLLVKLRGQPYSFAARS
jgi:hypothetical protein